ncbi:MAG: hypothetical protein ABI234_10705 [Ktedonobacteraceae bacterium]
MMLALKHVTRRMSLGLCSLVLLVLLVACGGPSTPSTIGTTPTPTPTNTPTPTPTPVTTQTYTGTGFTIGYPTGWTPMNQAGLGVAITDQLKANAVTVITTPATGTADQVSAAEATALIPIVMPGAQPITTVAPTTTFAGDTWAQKAYTGMTTVNGQSVKTRIYLLVNIHQGKAFVILYGGPDLAFDVYNVQYFQPMLQSFKFTA